MVLMSIVVAILIFSIIVLFHELGHFLLAKANGIRVNEFSLGLGPTIVGFTKGETKYSLKLLPFGGACMMEGEDEESQDSKAFNNKSVWARISVVLAGPVFNFIMAFILSVVVIAISGYDRPVISQVTEGSAAEAAGLEAGDEIISLGKKRIHLFKEIVFYTYTHVGESMDVVYERDGERYSTNLTPIYDEESGRYLLGVVSSGYEKGNIFRVLQHSWYEMSYYVETTIESLGMLIKGSVGINDLSGPVGIVSTIGDTFEESSKISGLAVFLNMSVMCVLLSANLGVMNLLPLPDRDGGRLLFLIIEAIRGKKIDQNKEGIVHFIGIILLFGLMIFVMFNDVRKLFF